MMVDQGYSTAINRILLRVGGTLAVLLLLASKGLASAEQVSIDNTEMIWFELATGDQRDLSISLYKSRVLQFQESISKVSIANPEIADILLINPSQMYVLGKALGSTNILVLDENDRLLTSISLEIRHDLENLQQNLRRLLPNENIQVSSSQGSIVLSGEVSSVHAVKTALDLAHTLLPQSKGLPNTKGSEKLEGNGVVNLLKVSGAQQIMLEVQVAEISRQFLKNIDVNFNLVGPDSRFKIGAVSGGSTLASLAGSLDSSLSVDQVINGQMSIPNKGVFTNFLDQNMLFNAVLNIAKEKGLAKILSEPTLTTLSGQEAKFVSGGEFPIPVPSSDGKVAIVFKEYGVALKFLPVVLDNNRINLKLDLAVSELSNSNTVTVQQEETASNLFVPSVHKRSVQNTVELAEGQTLGIAGLISDNVREKVNKFPGLAKLPIVGMLFRSQEFIKGQTELVIFVTPHFARPGQISEYMVPTEHFIEPTDTEYFLQGKMEGQTTVPIVNETMPQSPQYQEIPEALPLVLDSTHEVFVPEAY